LLNLVTPNRDIYLFGKSPEYKDFHHTVEKDGLHSKEMMGMEVMLRGMYLSRQMHIKNIKLNGMVNHFSFFKHLFISPKVIKAV
jgi:hypothetical protein